MPPSITDKVYSDTLSLIHTNFAWIYFHAPSDLKNLPNFGQYGILLENTQKLARIRNLYPLGDLDRFVREVFVAENSSENGSFFDHVAEYLEQKSNANIYFLTYEDISENFEKAVRGIAQVQLFRKT